MEEQKDFYDLDDYAGFWLRFAAYIIDAIAISFVVYPVFFVIVGTKFMGMDPATIESEMTPEMAMSMGKSFFSAGLFSMVAVWLYFALMESSAKQATLGKMAVGIKVTDEFGDPISFGRATGRHFSKIISGIILYIGFIMVAFTEKRQGLHDIIAKTLVLKKNVLPLN